LLFLTLVIAIGCAATRPAAGTITDNAMSVMISHAARDKLPHYMARTEPKLTGLATRHGSRRQQVIYLSDFFGAFLFRQLVELAEKLSGDSYDAEKRITLLLFRLLHVASV
jgi:hypothetical protein